MRASVKVGPEIRSQAVGLFRWLPLAGLAWLWIAFLLRVSLWWDSASYYTYGWSVPFLAGLLAWRTLTERQLRRVDPGDAGLMLPSALLVLYVPVRLIAEPDPFWRFPLWLEAFLLIGLSIAICHRLFGPVAARKVVIPCLFLLTALPWPAGLETALVQGMTSLVTFATAEALLWLGYPAEVAGHTLNVGSQQVLISNACSGIRSFQSLLAAAFFLIAYLRMGRLGAVLCLFTSIALAFFFNLCRAVALALVSLRGDADAYARWHDPIGFVSVGLSLLFLILVARGLRTAPVIQEGEEPFAIPFHAGLGPSVLMLIACLLPETLTLAWFQWVARASPVSGWHVQWPVATEAIEKPVEEVLLFDYGEMGRLPMGSGTPATVIHFGYDGSSPGASVCSRNHDPVTCMGHLGTHLWDGVRDVPFEVGDAMLLFRHYVAGVEDAQGRFPLHVWWCPWVADPRSGAFADLGQGLPTKARRFLSGRMSFERKVLLIILRDYRSPGDAERALKEVVRAIARPGLLSAGHVGRVDQSAL